MAFRTISFAHLSKFNSSASADFIEFYENAVSEKIIDKNSAPSHRTFAPSAFRCDRRSWFRLRGTEPDAMKTPNVDLTLNFKADMGTACHRVIQSTLKEALGDAWIDPGQYLADHCTYKYSVEQSADGLEALVEIYDPPVRFACDGIIRWKDSIYLLEIKSSEFQSFSDLTEPKPIHTDQIKFYAALFGIHNVLVLYQDRQYGGLKCYELTISDAEIDAIWTKIKHVQYCVEANIAPDRLSTRSQECSLTYCPYYKKCIEWG